MSSKFAGAALTSAAALYAASCDGARFPSDPGSPIEIAITVSPDSATIPVGGTVRLTATVTDAAGDTVAGHPLTWVSGNPAVATVTSGGVVTGVAPGAARVVATGGGPFGEALVVVRIDLRLPLPGGRHWRLVTEPGTPTAVCPGGVGGAEQGGGYDCSHSGASKYSLDFDDVTEEDGSLAGVRDVAVLAAAVGTVRDVCDLPPPALGCGPDGAYVTVDHAGGFRTIYAGLEPGSIRVRRKTDVARGQRLGVMAGPAGAGGARLHFEVRYLNGGSAASRILDATLADGLALADYRVGADGPRYYRSTNRAAHDGGAGDGAP